ncbi:uncharacterized protein [Diadema setosum]|uniref:uncharacterized protein n=1 Tax=Diadema setosum TaxID=31175 RepID=UPI003B3A75E3
MLRQCSTSRGTDNEVDRREGAPACIGFASRFALPSEEGEPLSEEHASSVNYLMTTPLEDKYLSETCGKYPTPSNCKSLTVPRVNPIIWDNLSSPVRALDMKLQRCQRPLVKGLAALMKATDPSLPLTETQQDAIALFSNASFELNQLRKDLIKPDSNSRYTHLCKPNNKTTASLFGDELHKTVRELDEQQKTMGVMKKHERNQHRAQTWRGRTGFHPYRVPISGSSMRPTASSRPNRYQEAGWTRRAQTQQPF